MSRPSHLYFKRRPHTHFDSHKHPACTQAIINFALQVLRSHHGQGCQTLEEPGGVPPPCHPLAWLFLVLTTLSNVAWEPGCRGAEAWAEATCRGGWRPQRPEVRAGALRGCAAMARLLAVRVVAGLAAATLAALLLEQYGLAGPSTPLPKPRGSQRPHPAPGSEANNVFWGLQVKRREARGGQSGGRLSPAGGLGGRPPARRLRSPSPGFVRASFSFPSAPRELAGHPCRCVSS